MCRPRTRPPPPAGPPFPEPVDGQAVYDYAGVFDASTIVQAEQIIDAIEAQTKAEVVVYTQAAWVATASPPRRPRPTRPP